MTLKFDLVSCIKFRIDDYFWLGVYKFASNLRLGRKLLRLVLNLIENGNYYAAYLALLRPILSFSILLLIKRLLANQSGSLW